MSALHLLTMGFYVNTALVQLTAALATCSARFHLNVLTSCNTSGSLVLFRIGLFATLSVQLTQHFYVHSIITWIKSFLSVRFFELNTSNIVRGAEYQLIYYNFTRERYHAADYNTEYTKTL